MRCWKRSLWTEKRVSMLLSISWESKSPPFPSGRAVTQADDTAGEHALSRWFILFGPLLWELVGAIRIIFVYSFKSKRLTSALDTLSLPQSMQTEDVLVVAFPGLLTLLCRRRTSRLNHLELNRVTLLGFPRFDELHGQPFTVSYTNRSLLINDKAALFLSGLIFSFCVVPYPSR